MASSASAPLLYAPHTPDLKRAGRAWLELFAGHGAEDSKYRPRQAPQGAGGLDELWGAAGVWASPERTEVVGPQGAALLWHGRGTDVAHTVPVFRSLFQLPEPKPTSSLRARSGSDISVPLGDKGFARGRPEGIPADGNGVWAALPAP